MENDVAFLSVVFVFVIDILNSLKYIYCTYLLYLIPQAP